MNYIFYHANCMDGLCAMYVSRKALLEKGETDITVVAVHYKQPFPEFNYQPTDSIFIVDFSFTKEILLDMSQKCNVVVLDHHVSAEKELKDLPFAHFDMSKSGAGMAWDYFYPEQKMPYVVQMVQDRDLWLFHIKHSNAFAATLQDHPEKNDYQFWDRLVIDGENYLMNDCKPDNICYQLIEEGKVIVKQVENICHNLISKKKYKIISIDGYQAALFNTTSLFSELGEYAYLNLDIDFSLSYFIKDDGHVIFSLRSAEDKVDVSEIAKKYGGGGHACAAGFSYPALEGFVFLESLYTVDTQNQSKCDSYNPCLIMKRRNFMQEEKMTSMEKSVHVEMCTAIRRLPKEADVKTVEELVGRHVVTRHGFNGVIVSPNMSPYGAFPASHYPVMVKLDVDFRGNINQLHAFKFDDLEFA